jgi:hypothetical protein
MSRIVLVVTGGRDFADAVKEWEQLDRIDREHEIVLVVHGQCMESTENGRPPKLRGADRWADEWATSREGHASACQLSGAREATQPVRIGTDGCCSQRAPSLKC